MVKLPMELPPLAPIILYPSLLIVPVLLGLSAYRRLVIPTKWQKYYADSLVLLPYMIPTDSETIRQDVLLCIAGLSVLLLQRALKLAIPLALRNIVDTLTVPNGVFPWTSIITYILLEHVISNLAVHLYRICSTRLRADLSDRIVVAMYEKLLSLSASFHDSHNAAITWNAISKGGPDLAHFVEEAFIDVVPNLLDMVIGVSAFWRICGLQMAVTVILVLVTHVLALSLFRPHVRGNYERSFKLRTRKVDLGTDTTQNWWTVRLFNRTEYEKARFRTAAAEARAEQSVYHLTRMYKFTGQQLVMVVGFTVVTLMITYQIRYGGQSVGDFVMLLHYWTTLTIPIKRTSSFLDWIDEFFVELDRLMEIVRCEPEVKDREDAPNFEYKSGTMTFENVGFSYDGKRQVLQNISFTVGGGQTLAIVGETGGGKSTLLKLLCRTYDVSCGSIKVDGQDVRDIRLDSLLEHIGIVPQMIGVFNGSVLENLSYAKLDSTQEECEAACQAAALHKKISLLPNGYGQAVGAQGVKLSGGELQRLAIARVLLRNSNIVLFDEAMSSLDSETESRIQDHIRGWSAGKTVVIIAHRLATIAHADLIVAIKDGQIVEVGRQADLMAKKGYFYELWDKQRLVEPGVGSKRTVSEETQEKEY